MDLPLTPNILLSRDPGILLLGVYMKETNPVSQRYLALPVLRLLCAYVSYKMNSDAHGLKSGGRCALRTQWRIIQPWRMKSCH